MSSCSGPFRPSLPLPLPLTGVRLVAGLTIVAALCAASPAAATSCSSWNRMSEDQKWARIDRMIDDAISGQSGRSYNVNRSAVGRCLDGRAENMYWDFEDTCADSRTADMQAIPRIFKNYIWTCAG